tara:strand:+ start:67 stop:237 length:171 start_codon:yes stop_codon:yes gene_type:complete
VVKGKEKKGKLEKGKEKLKEIHLIRKGELVVNHQKEEKEKGRQGEKNRDLLFFAMI